ncbi:uncharacterized protein LOC141899928 isoform X2 [Tubulanus polymorphus]|uniref:uncharacterized protein LOC141899928 isoform X2 n=1 Tax=Tubulanus polymorphus TaxID=672921 RepID=UPI003DA3694B
MEELTEHLPLGTDVSHWMTDDLRKPLDDSKVLPVLQWDNVFEHSPSFSTLQAETIVVQKDTIGNLGDEFLVDPRDESAMNFLLNNFDNLENDLENLSDNVIIDPCEFLIETSDNGFISDANLISSAESVQSSESSISSNCDKTDNIVIKKENYSGVKEINRSSKLVSLLTEPTKHGNITKNNIKVYKKQSNDKIEGVKTEFIKQEIVKDKSTKKIETSRNVGSATRVKKEKVSSNVDDNCSNKSKKVAKSSHSITKSPPARDMKVKSRSASPTVMTQAKPGPSITESPLLMEAMIKQASLPVRKVSKPKRPSVQAKITSKPEVISPPIRKSETLIPKVDECKSMTKSAPKMEKHPFTSIQVVSKPLTTSELPEKPQNVVKRETGIVVTTKPLNVASSSSEWLNNQQQTVKPNTIAVHHIDQEDKPTEDLVKPDFDEVPTDNKISETVSPVCSRNQEMPSSTVPTSVSTTSPQTAISPAKSFDAPVSTVSFNVSTVTSLIQSSTSSVNSYPNFSSTTSSVQLSDDDSNCSLGGNMGIAAMDVGSLLEQFEEVSAALVEQSKRSDFQTPLLQSYEPAECPSPLNGRKLIIPKKSLHQKVLLAKHVNSPILSPAITPSNSRPVSPPCAIIEKIKNAAKRKSAIMLPMSMPAKRDRGPPKSVAVASSPRVQRVIQNSDPLTAAESADREQVSLDHDYCFNTSNAQPQKCVQTCDTNINQSTSHPSSALTSCSSSPLPRIVTSDPEDIEVDIVGVTEVPVNPPLPEEECETSVVDTSVPLPPLPVKDDSVVAQQKTESSVLKTLLQNLHEECLKSAESSREIKPQPSTDIRESSNVNDPKVRLDHILEEFVDEEDQKNRFNRLTAERPDYKENNNSTKMGRRNAANNVINDEGSYFDKLPNYCTALAHSTKPTKKDILSEALDENNDHNHDRDPSPVRDDGPTVFNKLPAYYSCFTNSTKYDQKDCSGNNSLGDESDSSQCSPDQKKWSRSRSSRRSSRDSKRGRSYRSRSRSSSSSSGSRSPSSSRTQYQRDRQARPKYRRSNSYERKQLEKRRLAEEKNRKIDERRVVYVGNIPSNYTSKALRQRFSYFGEIEEANVHFREHGDNYGFVTFTYACDAFAAIEKGNDIPGVLRFDLCFGGRRQFCKSDYADLDGNNELEEELTTSYKRPVASNVGGGSFDDLLKQALARTKKSS